ncbi:YheC/YheD family protein [Bacillus sp. JJ1566]|uniref:YheC/YheD family endospore coat-associated protein n=1 Tax=Bacillus sp. JJ1566 TaxID=3122961 RepID=UPI002FFDF16D
MVQLHFRKENYFRSTDINDSTLYLSNKFLQTNNIHSNTILLKLGNWSKQFTITKQYALPEHIISLPEHSIPFTFPMTLNFEIKLKGDTLHLGPIIGFIAKKNKNGLTTRVLETYKSRLERYDEIGGLLFICTSDSIDTSNETIQGYYYNPEGKTVETCWVKGTFPYPDSIFKKIRIPSNLERNLRINLGNKLFNTNFFNKLQFWQICESTERLKRFVPWTNLFRQKHDLQDMLSMFDMVYLKPIRGKKGEGIYMIKKEVDHINLTNYKKEKQTFRTINELVAYLDQHIRYEDYILQQGMPTIYKNKHVDFRLYMQKDVNGTWVCQGSVGRVAQEESIVTNLKQIAHISTGEKAIRIVFQVDSEKAKQIMNNAIVACIEVCNVLDQKLGHFADVAIDLIIDKDYKPWILEINNLYGVKSLEMLKDMETLSALRTNPFLYARAIGGF